MLLNKDGVVDSIINRIVDQYGRSTLRKSAMNIRDGAGVFERVMSGRGIRSALEIGTYRGVSAAEMSRYCQQVITIDLAHGQLEQNNTTFDRAAFWASLDIENVTLQLAKDDEDKAEFINGLEFDFAFIDGAHDETVARDFDLVKRCGRVLFHDYDDRGQPCLNHVFDFVNSLPRHEIEIIDIFALWTAS